MKKKFEPEWWEVCYMALLLVIFGLWVGYFLGAFSSWLTEPDVRDVIILNGVVILLSLAIIFVLIEIIVHFYRKLESLKKNLNSKN